jgi:[protein-PII] uridylyltransferase
MHINWESIQVHARERLDSPAVSGNRAAQVEAFRRFLKLETERLRMRHRFGLEGLEIAAGRAYLVDVVVDRACRMAAAHLDRIGQRELAGCAVVALGGYGRGELAPYSDVDLLILHPGRRSPEVDGFVERTLQLLWDAGLTVGHSFRSPAECIAEASGDLHSRTALTEARLVSGSASLFQTLIGQVEAELIQSRRATETLLEALRREVQERHQKHGRTVCVLEPNVKDGPGGLRDLHTVLWVGHARYGARGLAGLRAEGWIGEAEYASVRRSYDLLWRVRNEAHFATGRKTDLLSLELQGDLAQGLGYRAKGGLLASELLMRDYYRRASELHGFCRTFLLLHLDSPPRRLFPGLRLRRKSRRGFETRDGRLYARGGSVVLKGGARDLMEAFETAQAEGVVLSEELKLAVKDRAHVIDRAFRSSREARASLLRLLGQRGRVGAALRAMHETGVLGRLLPEFARVTHLIQHDHFHKYTVDEHTLKAIEALDDIAAGSGPPPVRLGRAWDEVKDAVPLYVGMLLHDVGKGHGGGHVPRGVRIAGRISERLRLDPETTEAVSFLVGAHLEMSQTSQRRDLSEPGLIETFARRVRTLERLNLLLLLTYADHRGVGPGIWNEWKASLLWELYDRTRARLLAGKPVADEPEPGSKAREAAAAALGGEYPIEDVVGHLAALPERYLRSTDAERMVRHYRLIRSRGTRAAAFDWTETAGGTWTELTVTADDRPGLFATLAGTLTAAGIDILSVDLFTRADGIVLDSFRIGELPGHRPVGAERRGRIEAALEDAVAGRLDVAAAVEKWRGQQRRRPRRHPARTARPPVVRFDHQASAVATVVEVKAPDQPGLAYTIARTLAGLGLDIAFARVATSKALAVDVFYVRDAQGRKLDDPAVAGVESALIDALGDHASS